MPGDDGEATIEEMVSELRARAAKFPLNPVVQSTAIGLEGAFGSRLSSEQWTPPRDTATSKTRPYLTPEVRTEVIRMFTLALTASSLMSVPSLPADLPKVIRMLAQKER